MPFGYERLHPTTCRLCDNDFTAPTKYGLQDMIMAAAARHGLTFKEAEAVAQQVLIARARR